MDEKEKKSPCIKVCKLNEQKVCIGCGRHIDEIIAAGKARKLNDENTIKTNSRKI